MWQRVDRRGRNAEHDRPAPRRTRPFQFSDLHGLGGVQSCASGSDVLDRLRDSPRQRRPGRILVAPELVSNPPSALAGRTAVGESPVGLALVGHDQMVIIADSNRFNVNGKTSNLAVVSDRGHANLVLVGYVKARDFPRDMAVNPDGRTLVVSNYASGQVGGCNARRGCLVQAETDVDPGRQKRCLRSHPFGAWFPRLQGPDQIPTISSVVEKRHDPSLRLGSGRGNELDTNRHHPAATSTLPTVSTAR